MRKTLDDVMKDGAAATAKEAAEAKAWDEAIDSGNEGENPEMEADALFEMLAKSAEQQTQQRRALSPADVQRDEVPESPLIAELRASAGRAGTLVAPVSRLNTVIGEFAGTGPFAREGKLQRAMVVHVNSTPAALWDIRIDRPGFREESEQWAGAVREPAPEPPIRRVRAKLSHLRDSMGDLPMLVLVGDGCLEVLTWAALDQLAADVDATVVVLKDGADMTWTARDAVEPVRRGIVPQAAPVIDPEKPLGPVVSEREVATIARQLEAKGQPTAVYTMDGHRLEVAYHSYNAAGIVNEVTFRGWAEHDGHQWELEVESAAGLRAPLSKRPFKVR